jgi:hypothetical protein
MDPFRDATYEQLERVLNVIERTPPREKPGTGIPAIGFLERWIEDKLIPDDSSQPMSTESTIRMWEKAEPWKEQP